MTPGRLLQLLGGCVVLGTGVSLLLTPRLGSDGFSSLVSGLADTAGWSFMLANAVVSAGFLAMAWLRGVRPGLGTIVQVVVVGATVTALLPVLERLDPTGPLERTVMLLAALPVLAVGIALYLDSHLGAGPMEAAALAWDPPLPFAGSYSAFQLLSAVVGWQLGAAIGPGTIAVIFLLGPAVALAGRILGLELHPPGAADVTVGTASEPR